jgi:hypothetical protein
MADWVLALVTVLEYCSSLARGQANLRVQPVLAGTAPGQLQPNTTPSSQSYDHFPNGPQHTVGDKLGHWWNCPRGDMNILGNGFSARNTDR